MNNLTKEVVEAINKRIVEEAEDIKKIVFSGYSKETIIKHISNNINNIRELLDLLE